MIRLKFHWRNVLAGMLFFVFEVSRAEAGSISAEVDRRETVVEEPVRLTVTVEGRLEGQISIKDIPNVAVESRGTNTQISTSFGGGSGIQMLRQTIHTFELTPTKAESFRIPAIKVKVDGESMATLPIEIKVGSNTAGKDDAARGPGAPMRGIFAVEREIDAETVYVGEAVPVTVRLLAKAEIKSQDVEQKVPDTVRVVSGGNDDAGVRSRGGESIYVIEKRSYFVPLKPGSITIPELRATGIMLLSSGGGFFDTIRPVKRTATAPEVKWNVLPLPGGAPAGFSGLVGSFEFTGSLDRTEIKTGETASLHVVLEGNGMIEGWDLEKDLPLNLPAGLRAYASKPKIEFNSGDLAGQKKSFEIALVPTSSGEIKLPPLVLSFFNPKEKRYETKTVELPALKVTGEGLPQGAEAIPAPQVEGATDQREEGPQVDTAASVANAPLNLQLRNTVRWWNVLPGLSGWFAFAVAVILLLLPCLGFAVLRYRKVLDLLNRWEFMRSWRLRRRWSKAASRISETLSPAGQDSLVHLISETRAVSVGGLSKELDVLHRLLDLQRFGGVTIQPQDLETSVRSVVKNLGHVRKKKPLSFYEKTLGIIILSGLTACGVDRFTTQVEQTYAALSKGDAGGALEGWKNLVSFDAYQEDGCFNRGVLEAKNGDQALARAAFLAALIRSPGDEGVRFNAFHRSLLPGGATDDLKVEDLEASSVPFLSIAPMGFLRLAAVIGGLFWVIVWLVHEFVARIKAVLQLTGGVALLATLLLADRLVHTPDVAVIREDRTAFSPNPIEGEPTIFEFPKQAAVIVVERRQGYCRVRLPDGRSGWTNCGKLASLASL